jgi:hypothetical protein
MKTTFLISFIAILLFQTNRGFTQDEEPEYIKGTSCIVSEEYLKAKDNQAKLERLKVEKKRQIAEQKAFTYFFIYFVLPVFFVSCLYIRTQKKHIHKLKSQKQTLLNTLVSKDEIIEKLKKNALLSF